MPQPHSFLTSTQRNQRGPKFGRVPKCQMSDRHHEAVQLGDHLLGEDHDEAVLQHAKQTTHPPVTGDGPVYEQESAEESRVSGQVHRCVATGQAGPAKGESNWICLLVSEEQGGSKDKGMG